MIQKKICMVGPVSVGKTSLVARYVHSLFSERYLSTVGVKIDKKPLQVDGTDVTLLLWDLAGDDDFQRLNLTYLRGAAAYLLVADGSRRSTLDQATAIQARVGKALGPIPFLLALNKADLEAEWEIEAARVSALTSQGWLVRRTSAKDGSGVEAAFLELARHCLRRGGGATGSFRTA
jgi:small GTP-binding protein